MRPIFLSGLQASTLVTLAILAGCSAARAPNTPHETVNVVYQCDNGLPLRVSYDRTSNIAIVNELISLPQATSGSGFRYQAVGHDLQGTGNEVIWVAGRLAPRRCTAVG
jgi:membrane-bound inhibitor of C-type lysozyme